ncbi:TIGR03759 family integrating conjugative element protein [Billgrantia montanilacus]|uniref:TIGR03759 family integrating conjugative element protein n=1 Tax=Billgrantia montanilacus TaxID=2282305 RepID=A0A368TS05_9GAMM|nr:TIGR03759 family integrating conjugative element protein [Halomonas montanilacus]RCV86902.1 TIGR03759 family integrating conjugative element protein [Halomonas montanilacus]
MTSQSWKVWRSGPAFGIGAALCLWLLALPASAQTLAPGDGQTNSQDTSGIEERDSHIRDSLRAEAREWGLDEREWQRYETLMEGSRGIWSPDLDPLTALGIEAETEAERRRYAEMLVEVERARVERELAFQRAYDEAWQRLYPNEMPVEQFLLGDPGQAGQGSVSFLQGAGNPAASSRLSVHVASQACASCDATIRELLDSGVAMDVFVIDSEGDDTVIRQWARDNSIPLSRVQSREITLNHGRTDTSLGVTRDSVPQVFPR